MSYREHYHRNSDQPCHSKHKPKQDWREMFKKYVLIVGEMEGVDFLYAPGDRISDSPEWTQDEWDGIQEMLDET